MREIEFRGLSQFSINGKREWAYGLPEIRKGYEYCIIRNEIGLGIDVELETVGQYTGLKDKNGKKIFEGDIVKDGDNENYEVDFDDGTYMAKIFIGTDNMTGYNLKQRFLEDAEVIGNIHDNPELLKEVYNG